MLINTTSTTTVRVSSLESTQPDQEYGSNWNPLSEYEKEEDSQFVLVVFPRPRSLLPPDHPRSLPVTVVILWILTLWPTDPRKTPNLNTTQSWTWDLTDLTWQIYRCLWSWPPYGSWWKTLQTHCWEGPIKVGIGTPRVEQNQNSQSERGNDITVTWHIWGFQGEVVRGRKVVTGKGKLSNIYYKCTDGWIKLVLRSTSFVVPRAHPLCRNRGVGKTVLLLQGETDISVG
jgi:hypothetical protein